MRRTPAEVAVGLVALFASGCFAVSPDGADGASLEPVAAAATGATAFDPGEARFVALTLTSASTLVATLADPALPDDAVPAHLRWEAALDGGGWTGGRADRVARAKDGLTVTYAGAFAGVGTAPALRGAGVTWGGGGAWTPQASLRVCQACLLGSEMAPLDLFAWNGWLRRARSLRGGVEPVDPRDYASIMPMRPRPPRCPDEARWSAAPGYDAVPTAPSFPIPLAPTKL